MDCCCSAGLNRGSTASTDKSGFVERYIPNPPPLSADTDADLIAQALEAAPSSTRGLRHASGFAGQFQDSHVLLAACGRNARAWERAGSGVFTYYLLKALGTLHQIGRLQDTTVTELFNTISRRAFKLPPELQNQYASFVCSVNQSETNQGS